MKNTATSFALASALCVSPALFHNAKAQGFGPSEMSTMLGGALVTQTPECCRSAIAVPASTPEQMKQDRRILNGLWIGFGALVLAAAYSTTGPWRPSKSREKQEVRKDLT